MSALAISIDWGALGQVALASLIFGVGVVTIFSFGITALSRRDDGNAVTANTAIAAACFVVCAAAVLYGLYLIIPQFH